MNQLADVPKYFCYNIIRHAGNHYDLGKFTKKSQWNQKHEVWLNTGSDA